MIQNDQINLQYFDEDFIYDYYLFYIRLKIKYKSKDGVKKNVHTLNGSALAIPRVMASLMENCQTENGIEIPECLVPYTGFKIIN